MKDNTNTMKSIGFTISILAFMAFWANGDNYAAAPLIIKIAEDLHITISVAALSATSYMLTFGFFTIIFGPLSDRYGKVKIINIAAFGTALFSILGAFAQDINYLLVVRGLNGAFAAGIFPVTMALVGEIVPGKHRQSTIGKVMGMMFLGGAAATLIGGTVAYFGSWRHVYFIYGVIELIIAVTMFIYLKRDVVTKKEQGLFTPYKEAFKSKRLLLIISVIFVMGYSVFGTFTFLGEYLNQITNMSLVLIGLTLSSFGVGTVVGGKIAPKLRMKLKNKYLLFFGILGGVSLLLIPTITNAIIIAFLLFVFGFSFISLQSYLVMNAQNTLPNFRGTAMSLASFNMFVGGGIATIVNGKLIELSSFTTIFVIAGVLLGVIGIVATFALNTSK
jgi:predicted MFS family arabinose efflux permease